jgi:hypothetical protein
MNDFYFKASCIDGRVPGQAPDWEAMMEQIEGLYDEDRRDGSGMKGNMGDMMEEFMEGDHMMMSMGGTKIMIKMGAAALQASLVAAVAATLY